METAELNVVVFMEDKIWVAQCLEHDISARAPSLKLLPKKLFRTVAANVCANEDLGRKGLEGIPPAPAYFRQMFDSAEMQLRPLGAAKAANPYKIGDLRYAEAA